MKKAKCSLMKKLRMLKTVKLRRKMAMSYNWKPVSRMNDLLKMKDNLSCNYKWNLMKKIYDHCLMLMRKKNKKTQRKNLRSKLMLNMNANCCNYQNLKKKKNWMRRMKLKNCYMTSMNNMIEEWMRKMMMNLN